jgi:hypothetical protein
MAKFDTSCGLPEKIISIIKGVTTRKLIINNLPLMPEYVETKLFFEGREAWVFGWELLENNSRDPLNMLRLGVTVKLKKEFHSLNIPVRYRYLCKVEMVFDVYSPVISIQEEKIPS